jgi:XTP/dITP diphosphohydrolase
MKKLVLASNNAKKMKELNALLAPLGFEVIPQGQLGIPEAEEPHCTFVENALAKARRCRQAACRRWPTIRPVRRSPARRPGVLSARYAGDPSRPATTSAARLKGTQPQGPLCVLVLVRAADDPQPIIAEGPARSCRNSGRGGFGYDPLFFVPDFGQTAAEMDAKPRTGYRTAAGRLKLIERLPSALHKALNHPAHGTEPPPAPMAHHPDLRHFSPKASRCHRARIPRLAAACPLRPCAVVRAEVPLLRFQLARGRRDDSRARLRRRADRRPAIGPAADLGPAGGQRLLWRRHAQPAVAGRHRRTARRLPRPGHAGAGCRDHAGSQPGTVEAEKFAGFRAAGVNRLSLGIQSFNDAHLQALGRIHGAAEAKRAAHLPASISRLSTST